MMRYQKQFKFPKVMQTEWSQSQLIPRGCYRQSLVEVGPHSGLHKNIAKYSKMLYS